MLFAGVMASLWADIEEMFDLYIEHIHDHGGAKWVQSHLPGNLDRKLDYLTKARKIGLVYAGHTDELGRLVGEAHRLKMFRHIMIHGQPVEFGEEGRLIIDHWRVRAAARIQSRTTYSHAQVLRHLDQTIKLKNDLLSFVSGEYSTEA